MSELMFLSESDVNQAFTPEIARASQQAAFEALGRGDAVLPARLIVPGHGDDVAFCYAARAGAKEPAVSKFGAVHSGNAALGLPAVHALVTVLDAATGAPRCVMAGTNLTTRRTAAASAVAAEALHAGSGDPGCDLAIIGSGVQAWAHAEAFCATRPVRRIRLGARNQSSAAALAERWSRQHPDAPAMEVTDSVESACRDADVVALCTTSATPVVDRAWMADGALVVTVGSFSSDRAEVPPDLMAEARIVVDDRETALADNGSVVRAIDAGALDEARLETLGEVLVGATDVTVAAAASAQNNSDDARVTVYASVGVGIQDATAAAAVVEAAEAAGIGTRLAL